MQISEISSSAFQQIIGCEHRLRYSRERRTSSFRERALQRLVHRFRRSHQITYLDHTPNIFASTSRSCSDRKLIHSRCPIVSHFSMRRNVVSRRDATPIQIHCQRSLLCGRSSRKKSAIETNITRTFLTKWTQTCFSEKLPSGITSSANRELCRRTANDCGMISPAPIHLSTKTSKHLTSLK